MSQVDSMDRGLLPPLPPMSDSQRTALRELLADSMGFKLVQRGDTTDVIAVTPEARALGESIHRGLRKLSIVSAIVVIVWTAIYLPIPIGLTAMTAIWLWQRRRLAPLPK